MIAIGGDGPPNEEGRCGMNGSPQMEVAPAPAATAVVAEPRRAAETLRLRELIRQRPAVRMDKVRRMRQLIARGKLETPTRIEETVRRLTAELCT